MQVGHRMEHHCLVDRNQAKTSVYIRARQHCRSGALTFLLLSVCSFVALTLGWCFWKLDTPRLIFQSSGLRVIVSTGDMKITRNGHRLLSGSLGLASSEYFKTLCEDETWRSYSDFDNICGRLCDGEPKQSGTSFCSVYGKTSILQVVTIPSGNKTVDETEVTCHRVSWEKHGCQEKHVEDCFCVGQGFWYGGSASQGLPRLEPDRSGVNSPYWRSQPQEASVACRKEKYEIVDSTLFSKWEEKYFLFSRGFAIFVPRDIPISLRYFYNHKSPKTIARICLRAQPRNTKDSDKTVLGMNYTLCYSDSIKTTHLHMLAHHIGKKSPSSDVINLPIEPIWDIPKATDQQKAFSVSGMNGLQEFQGQLAEHNFTNNLVVFHGSLWDDYMNSVTLKEIIPETYIKSFWRLSGVSVPVHPFVNLNSPLFHKLFSRGNFMLDQKGVVMLAKWRGETCAVLDFNNSLSVFWFAEKLRHLQLNVRSLSVTSEPFVFDLLNDFLTEGRLGRSQLESFVSGYLSVLSEVVTRTQGLVVVQSTSISVATIPPRNDVFVQLSAVEHLDAGAMIRQALRFCMLNFTWLMSPRLLAIPVHPCSSQSKSEYTSWALAASLLPAFLLPYPPWCFKDPKIINSLHDIINQRRSFLEDIQEETPAHGALEALAIRPLWWLDPTDVECHKVENHLVLGDKVVVLPPPSGEVNLYLPKGKWLEKSGKYTRVLRGGQWFRNHKIPPERYLLYSRLY